MLDPKLIRHDINAVALKLKKRGMTLDVSSFLSMEENRKQLQTKIQELQNERNVRSKEVGIAKAKGNPADDILLNLKELSDALKKLENDFSQLQNSLDDFLSRIPNIPHDSVPEGLSEENNVVVRSWGNPTQFTFTPKDHVELGTRNHWMDFEAAAKISGSRFVVLQGPLARLSRGLIRSEERRVGKEC